MKLSQFCFLCNEVFIDHQTGAQFRCAKGCTIFHEFIEEDYSRTFILRVKQNNITVLCDPYSEDYFYYWMPGSKSNVDFEAPFHVMSKKETPTAIDNTYDLSKYLLSFSTRLEKLISYS